MAFTTQELANIANAALENYIERGTVFKQNISNKPLLKAFDDARGSFNGGKDNVSLAVKSGLGGGSLTGYTHDDQVGYYTPATIKRARYPWKEHHIGQTITFTELKTDGIDIIEDGARQSTSNMDGREEHALANLMDEKLDELSQDYAYSLDRLLHGDGTADVKAIAGIGALLLAVPNAGTTGGVNRAANTWWQNRAATAAYGSAGGQGAITSSSTGGGALLQFLQKDLRLLTRYAQGGTNWKFFAGTDFIDALEKELRANGNYTLDGFMKPTAVEGGMAGVTFKGIPFVWDPTLDDLSLSKRCYVIDMKRIKLLYMDGQRMKKHNPARPYDRYVMYNGMTTTAVMAAQQLNTSAVYDVA